MANDTLTPEDIKTAKRLAKAQNALKLALAALDQAKQSPGACIPCAREKAAKARLAVHNLSIEAHEGKYERLKQNAEQENKLKSARGYQALVTEAEGEEAATKYMKDKHPEYQLESGFAQGTGFDQIWVKRGAKDEIEEIMIVEAKGHGQKLATGADKGPQMTGKWVRATAKEWSDDPETKEVARKIFEWIKPHNPKLKGKVIQDIREDPKGVGYKELDCPDWKK